MAGEHTDLITVGQNLVRAFNGLTDTYATVNGKTNTAAIAAATIVKSSGGRLATVSVTTAGAVGAIYDTVSLTDTTKPVYVIPAVLGVYIVNLPMNYGIVVAPGSGQVVTVGWS